MVSEEEFKLKLRSDIMFKYQVQQKLHILIAKKWLRPKLQKESREFGQKYKC